MYSDGGTPVTASVTAQSVDLGPFSIGRNPIHGRYWEGLIAYVQFFDVPITAIEASEMWIKPGMIPTDLEGFWPIWGVDDPELDLSKNNNTAALTNGPTLSTDGPPVGLGGLIPL